MSSHPLPHAVFAGAFLRFLFDILLKFKNKALTTSSFAPLYDIYHLTSFL
jgi:hypothetical protein